MHYNANKINANCRRTMLVSAFEFPARWNVLLYVGDAKEEECSEYEVTFANSVLELSWELKFLLICRISAAFR